MDTEIETWKQIPAPFGLFEASSLGRIRRLCDGFVMASGKSADGYCRIPLRLITGGKRTVYVHRLVAMTFCAGDHSQTVNHLNMQKDDNRASNLEWVSFSENHRKGRALKPGWSQRVGAKLSKAVVATSHDGMELRYPSGKAAAIALGSPNKAANISHAVASGGMAYGFYWKLAD